MATEEDTKRYRRERLIALRDGPFNGNATALGVFLGYKDGAFVRQMISGHREITEKTINKVHANHAYRHWFDQANVEPAMDMPRTKYPLISFVQAGGWTSICDNFQPGDADEWHPSSKNLGPHGYILRVLGKSMYAPGYKYSFDEGMLLHVNPSMDPIPGQFVIVRRNGSQEATFKRYILIDGQPYLEAINPDWPKEEKYLKLLPDDEWCGVVVDASINSLP